MISNSAHGLLRYHLLRDNLQCPTLPSSITVNNDLLREDSSYKYLNDLYATQNFHLVAVTLCVNYTTLA